MQEEGIRRLIGARVKARGSIFENEGGVSLAFVMIGVNAGGGRKVAAGGMEVYHGSNQDRFVIFYRLLVATLDKDSLMKDSLKLSRLLVDTSVILCGRTWYLEKEAHDRRTMVGGFAHWVRGKVSLRRFQAVQRINRVNYIKDLI